MMTSRGKIPAMATGSGVIVDAPGERVTAVAGADIVSHEAGKGAPLVWFHHSFGSPGWGPAQAQLAADHRVIVPDLPGFGASGRLDWARDPRDLGIALGLWLDLLDAGPVVGVGC